MVELMNYSFHLIAIALKLIRLLDDTVELGVSDSATTFAYLLTIAS